MGQDGPCLLHWLPARSQNLFPWPHFKVLEEMAGQISRDNYKASLETGEIQPRSLSHSPLESRSWDGGVWGHRGRESGKHLLGVVDPQQRAFWAESKGEIQTAQVTSGSKKKLFCSTSCESPKALDWTENWALGLSQIHTFLPLLSQWPPPPPNPVLGIFTCHHFRIVQNRGWRGSFWRISKCGKRKRKTKIPSAVSPCPSQAQWDMPWHLCSLRKATPVLSQPHRHFRGRKWATPPSLFWVQSTITRFFTSLFQFVEYS